MLVRYRMNSSCTVDNMRADINAIIAGTATFDANGVPTNLSAGCNTTASIKYGTYPSAKYAKVGTGATASGTASSIVVTNPTEPILNTATMVTTVAGIARNTVIRTGNPKIFENASTSVQSLVYLDTEITDIQSQALEAKVTTIPTVTVLTTGELENPQILQITPTPTYAYSSGEEIITEEQGAATSSQIWTLS